MPFQGRPAPQGVGIVLDMDLGNSIDDALVMAMLNGLEAKSEARLIAISVSKPNLKAAALCEAIGRFYAGAVNSGFGGQGRTLPVGLNYNGKPDPDTPMLTVPLSKKNPDGTPVYPHGIDHLNDTAEPVALIRNAFTAQQDKAATMVLTGPATTLSKVVGLKDGRMWAERKVKQLFVMGGSYPNGATPEYNIKADIPAAKQLFAMWPTPIIASGFEVGEQLLYPASSIEKDFAWAPNHPVVDAYKAYKPMPYDAPTWDLTVILQAARPQANYFKLSEPGTISVLDDGRTKFTPSANGLHRYMILDPAKKDEIIKAYVDLVSAKPAPRPQRFRGGAAAADQVQQEQKKQPPQNQKQNQKQDQKQ